MHAGRTKSVLIVNDGGRPTSVLTDIIIHKHDDRRKHRLHLAGDVHIDAKTFNHIEEVIIPLIDRIIKPLAIPASHYDLSIKNINAVSIYDQSFEIQGYSADAPIFLAILSSTLNLPLPSDFVSTGYISSMDGDINLVRSIPEKLLAAMNDSTIQRFVYPALDGDHSMMKLAPRERGRIKEALLTAKNRIECIPVRTITELIQSITTDETILTSSLSANYFGIFSELKTNENHIGQTIRYLTENHESLFWNVLERDFLSSNMESAHTLLLARARDAIERKEYPQDFGRKLLQLIASLPPAIKRLKTVFPLLPLRECLHLGQFHKEPESQDVRWLISASSGDHISQTIKQKPANEIELLPVSDKDHAGAVLDLILAEISDDVLSKSIDIPIDTARATYCMDSVVVETVDEFNQIVAGFYLHLLRHTRHISSSIPPEQAGSEAYGLLERAYAKWGSDETAVIQALTGTQGGLRRVLDTLTDHFKQEEREKYVHRVFKESLSSCNWDTKTSIMSNFLNRIAHQLSPDIQTELPERYTHDIQNILILYTKSMEDLQQRLKRL